MSRKKNSGNTRLLPFSVIDAAVNGDVEAINKVLNHYEGYIVMLSTRRMYDEQGKAHLFVDNELRRILETKLIVKILQFDIKIAA